MYQRSGQNDANSCLIQPRFIYSVEDVLELTFAPNAYHTINSPYKQAVN